MKQHPHLIIIMADQLRYDFIQTEFMPRVCTLMAESAQFPRMYCASPLCVPARGAFFTGRYPNETGCLINGWEPIDQHHGKVAGNTPNLYKVFENAGYDSWHTGKQHLHTEDHFDTAADSCTHWNSLENLYQGHLQHLGKQAPGGTRFTGICPEMHARKTTAARRYSIPHTGNYDGGLDGFFDGHILKESLDAIENRDPGKPFLLNAMFLAPHPPLDIPSPWYEKYKEIPLPDTVGRWSPLQSPLNLYHMAGAIGARYQRHEWQEPWRVYAGLVNLLDHCVGQILDKLKENGMYEDSIILFTADHGEMLGSHCLWQKMVLYEESARTPLSIRLPKGSNMGIASEDPVSHVDAFPTLCDLAGIPIPDTVSGHSLRPEIEGNRPAQHRPVFIQSDGNGSLEKWSRGLIINDKKLIIDGFKDEIFFEFYNLKEDPCETNNIAFSATNELLDYLAILLAHMKKTGDLVCIAPADFKSFCANYAYLAK